VSSAHSERVKDKPTETDAALTAVTPIDGRYRARTRALEAYFSEFALIRYRPGAADRDGAFRVHVRGHQQPRLRAHPQGVRGDRPDAAARGGERADHQAGASLQVASDDGADARP